MQLELKHIAPYLPYDLKIEYVEHGIKKISEISLLSPFGLGLHSDVWRGFEAVKLILKDIDDFNPHEKKLEVEDFIGIGNWCEAYDEYMDIFEDNIGTSEALVLQAPQPIFQYFLSQHYDVFDLISKGLAISESEATK